MIEARQGISGAAKEETPARLASNPMVPPMPIASLLQQALAAHQQGRLADAAALYEAVLAQDPRNPDALHLLGVVVAEGGDTARAAALIQAAIAEQPRSAVFHFNYANLLQTMGALPQAVAHFDLASANDPANAQVWFNRGNCLGKMGQQQDSLASFDTALRIRPDYVAAQLNRGVALQALGRHDDAIAAFQAACRLRPGHVQALCNLGNVLRIVGSWAEARAACEQAVAINPGHADAHANLGNVLQNIGDHAGALAAYASALAIAPEHVNARFNRSLVQLRLGDYRTGWQGYEWRKRLTTPVAERRLAAPPWLGDADISGRTVFLHWEQGLGDTLQFCRFALLVRERGAKVVLSVPEPLVRLVRTLDPDIDVISTHAVPTHFDLHCPLMSLPLALGTTLETIPAQTPYLHPDPAKTATWRTRLAALPGLKVGLVWSGAARPEDPLSDAINRRRSISLAAFAPLGRVDGVSLISLQKRPPATEPPPDGLVLHDWTDELHDFLDTAALATALDLIITVDTSVAHMAGALGRPVWILNRFDHCWRWLSGEGGSPWYPTARLFRQPAPDTWPAVIAEVAQALQALTPSPA